MSLTVSAISAGQEQPKLVMCATKPTAEQQADGYLPMKSLSNSHFRQICLEDRQTIHNFVASKNINK